MRTIISIAFVLVTISCFAQKSEDFVGTWTVKEIQLLEQLPQEQMIKVQKHLDELKTSSLEFLQDHRFSFRSSIADLDIKNEYWYYNEENKIIAVSEWSDRKSILLGLIIQNFEENSIQFLIYETPIVMVVEKKQ
jgi:hypothetical protein